MKISSTAWMHAIKKNHAQAVSLIKSDRILVHLLAPHQRTCLRHDRCIVATTEFSKALVRETVRLLTQIADSTSAGKQRLVLYVWGTLFYDGVHAMPLLGNSFVTGHEDSSLFLVTRI
jgi:hypothetical protein